MGNVLRVFYCSLTWLSCMYFICKTLYCYVSYGLDGMSYGVRRPLRFDAEELARVAFPRSAMVGLGSMIRIQARGCQSSMRLSSGSQIQAKWP